MIDYEIIKSLEDKGMDEISISEYLSSRTVSDISASDLENFLSEQGLARRNPITGAWQGSLIDVMSDGGALGDALEELFSHLNKPRSVSIETTSSPWAEKASLLISGLFVLGSITEDQASGIYEMAGGKLYADGVSLDDIVESRNQRNSELADIARKEEINDLSERIFREFISPAMRGNQTAAEVIDSIKQGL